MNSLRERLVSLVGGHEEGLKTAIASKILQEKPNTIKSLMHRLSKENVLIKDFHGLKGFYGINPALQKSTDGIDSFGLPKIQNLWICSALPIEVKPLNEEFCIPSKEVPMWKIRTIIGAKSKKLSISFSGESGYEFQSVYCILRSKMQEMQVRFGLNLSEEDFVVENVELFVDVCGLSISENSFTLKDLSSTLVKFYNKKGRVRVEQRTSVPMPLDFFFSNLSNPFILNYARSVNDGWNKIESVSKNLESGMQSSNYIQKQILNEIKELRKKELK